MVSVIERYGTLSISTIKWTRRGILIEGYGGGQGGRIAGFGAQARYRANEHFPVRCSSHDRITCPTLVVEHEKCALTLTLLAYDAQSVSNIAS